MNTGTFINTFFNFISLKIATQDKENFFGAFYNKNSNEENSTEKTQKNSSKNLSSASKCKENSKHLKPKKLPLGKTAKKRILKRR